MARLRITWIRSASGRQQNQHASLKTLGLKRLNQSVERDDTPSTRGLINAVNHLVKVEEVS